MHQNREVHDNLSEVLVMEKINKSDIRIGPELNVNVVDNIETHSSFIYLKCNKKVNKMEIFRVKLG